MQDQPLWSPSQLAAQRVAKRRPTFYASLNLWPFLGSLLVLFIILSLVTGTPFHYHRWGRVRLPVIAFASLQPSADRDDAISIIVARDGYVFFGNSQAHTEELSDLIRLRISQGAERKVYLAVDSRARYADVQPVLDAIRYSQIKDICLIGEKPTH